MSTHPTFDAAGALVIRSWDELPGAIALAEQAGAIGLAHLLRANLQGRIAFLPLVPSTSARTFKQFLGQTRNKPAVILIGDDDYSPAAGPSRWPIAERAMRWAATFVLHCAGAEVHHYEAAIQAVQVVRRVLFIETSTKGAEAWIDLIDAEQKRSSTVAILPREGAHPIVPAREVMQ